MLFLLLQRNMGTTPDVVDMKAGRHRRVKARL